MTTEAEWLERLDRYGRTAETPGDLAEGALVLAGVDYPNRDPAPYRVILTDLVERVTAELGPLRDDATGLVAADAAADVLNRALLTDFGLEGDEESYDDPDNANLYRVLDRRRGLPIALGILYLHVGRSAGLQLTGLNFPGHFLIRIDGSRGTRLIVDPFHRGAVVDIQELRRMLKHFNGADAELSPEDYRPVGNREVLLRLQNNLKLRDLRTGRLEHALLMAETMRRLAPERPGLLYEIGMLKVRLGDVDGALSVLEDFLSAATDPVQRRRAGLLLAELREKQAYTAEEPTQL